MRINVFIIHNPLNKQYISYTNVALTYVWPTRVMRDLFVGNPGYSIHYASNMAANMYPSEHVQELLVMN